MGTPHAYFQRKFVPLAEAKIGVMTHAFNYGTAVFEGIRGNWNGDDEQIYVFRLEDHFRRMRKNCRILKIDFPYTDEELADITVLSKDIMTVPDEEILSTEVRLTIVGGQVLYQKY